MQPDFPRLLLRAARIRPDWTRPTQTATSLLLEHGCVAAIDPSPEQIGAAPVLDLGSSCISPGLIDAHVHMLMGAEFMTRLDLAGVRSRAEFEAAIEAQHESLPEGAWLIASGWSDGNWPGHALPDSSWLRAAGDRPVVAYRMDLHGAVVNEPVLEQAARRWAELGKPGPLPGVDTGFLVEAALWEGVNPLIPPLDAAARQNALVQAQPKLHAMGLTALGPMEYMRDVLDVIQPMRDDGRLTIRCPITVLDRDWPLDLEPGRSFPGDGMLRIHGYKAFLDGSFGSRTAKMLEPYADDPNNTGQFVELAADGHLEAWISAVLDAGFSPSMHAIGDAAVRLALDVALGSSDPSRVRIEHAQHVHPDDMARFNSLFTSMQPLHRADDGRFIEERLGAARLPGAFAFRQLESAGAKLVFGSDWPVVTPDPIAGARAAITGLTLDGTVFRPEENLSVEETFRAYTCEAANALAMEGGGMLQSGGPADLVAFDVDPCDAAWSGAPPRVLMTMVGGSIVHLDESLEAAVPHAMGSAG